MCNIGAPGHHAATNACFERSPLRFANRASVVRFRDGGARILPDATDVTEGVQPAGSAWRRLPIPACACDIGTNCQNASTARANDTQATAYGSPGDVAHLKCGFGLQFAAAHLTDGTWPEGYGYYVADLGRYQAAAGGKGEKGSDPCGQYGNAAACQAASVKQGCTWFATKSECYTEKAANACEAEADATACANRADCQWYSAKRRCYSAKSKRALMGRQLNDFGGQSAAEDTTVPSWRVEDEVVAPEKPGRYLLQWRWVCVQSLQSRPLCLTSGVYARAECLTLTPSPTCDRARCFTHLQDNEQTPQIWTTCADVEVVKPGVTWGLVAGVAVGVSVTLGAAVAVSRKWKGHGRCTAAAAKAPAMAQIQPTSAGCADRTEPAGQLQLQLQQHQA